MTLSVMPGQQPRGRKVRTLFNWMGLMGGLLMGAIFALAGNVVIGAGVGLGFALFSIGAGWINSRGLAHLSSVWLGTFLGLVGGLMMASDHATTLVSVGFGLTVGVLWSLGLIWVGLLGPVDRKTMALFTGEQRRRSVQLRRWWLVTVVLAFVPVYILAVARHPPRHAVEWAFLGLVSVWSTSNGLQVLVFKPSRSSGE